MMGRTFYLSVCLSVYFHSITFIFHVLPSWISFSFLPSVHPSHYVVEAGLKLLASNAPPIPASEELGLVVKSTVPSTQLLYIYSFGGYFYGARD